MSKTSAVFFASVAVVALGFWLAGRGGNPSAPQPLEVNGVMSGTYKPDSRLLVAASGVAQPTPTAGGHGRSADLAKVHLLDEILASRNDNDPRLDRDFKDLSVGAKELMRARYLKISAERRNEKGTIIFLLGRNLTSEADFQFLHEVLEEPPCRSLADCAREMPGSTTSEALHLEAGSEVTLAYPQLVALKSMESYLLSDRADPRLVTNALKSLEAAKRSPIVRVAEVASEILEKYQRSRH